MMDRGSSESSNSATFTRRTYIFNVKANANANSDYLQRPLRSLAKIAIGTSDKKLQTSRHHSKLDKI
ncbi:hypothetical protein E2P81_ATG01671 [Venturia nashicola]|nr:hypothetical protein E2P81_ATG01671 [Venturia nashicola]